MSEEVSTLILEFFRRNPAVEVQCFGGMTILH